MAMAGMMTTMVVSKLVMAMMAEMMKAVKMMEVVAVTVPMMMAVVMKLQARTTHGSPLYVEGTDARNPLRDSFNGSFDR
jgi:hypothetical protein